MKLKQIFKKCEEFGLYPAHLYGLYCVAEAITPSIESLSYLESKGLIDNHRFLTAKGRELLMELDRMIKAKPDKKSPVDIPVDRIIEFNNLWPSHKLPHGVYGRCSNKELESSFKAFFKSYPSMTDWDTILLAANIYIQERELEEFRYTKRSKYFVRRELSDKSMESTLAEYYERLINNTQELPEQASGFEPRVR